MNEILAPTFESEVQEIEKALPHYEDLTKNPERHKEIIHEQLKEKIQDIQQMEYIDSEITDNSAPTRSVEMSEQEQLQELVNVAFNQSIEHAVKQAARMGDPKLIDDLHDALTTELFEHLVERQKLAKL